MNATQNKCLQIKLSNRTKILNKNKNEIEKENENNKQ